MILEIFITDAELKAFFEGLGYQCKMVDVPVVEKRSHGTSPVREHEELHVHAAGADIPAKKLMNEYVKVNILRPVGSSEANIDQAVRNLTRRK